jgi:AcrR family transcriptional regulator
MRRSYHHGDLREAVLACAMDKIEVDGYESLSRRDLARECGVSPSAPQKHFPTKDDLLTALAERGYLDLARSLAATDADGPLDRALTDIALAYVGFVVDHPLLFQLMQTRRLSGDDGVVAEASAQAYAPIDALLDRARSRGEVTGSRHAVETYVRVMLRGLANSFSIGALQATDRALVRQIIKLSLAGLQPR